MSTQIVTVSVHVLIIMGNGQQNLFEQVLQKFNFIYCLHTHGGDNTSIDVNIRLKDVKGRIVSDQLSFQDTNQGRVSV